MPSSFVDFASGQTKDSGDHRDMDRGDDAILHDPGSGSANRRESANTSGSEYRNDLEGLGNASMSVLEGLATVSTSIAEDVVTASKSVLEDSVTVNKNVLGGSVTVNMSVHESLVYTSPNTSWNMSDCGNSVNMIHPSQMTCLPTQHVAPIRLLAAPSSAASLS